MLTEKSASFLAVSTAAFVQGQQRALVAAEKAIASDPTLAHEDAARGAVWIESWDWNSAQTDIEQARAWNPQSVSNYACTACFLATQGRLPEAIAAIAAIAAMRKGIEPNPLPVEEWITLARFEIAVGAFPAARQALNRGLAISPKSGSMLFFYLGLAPLLEDHPGTARAHAAGLASEPACLVLLAAAEHDLQHPAASQQVLEALIAKYAQDAPYRVAEVYSLTGRPRPRFLVAGARPHATRPFPVFSQVQSSIPPVARSSALLRAAQENGIAGVSIRLGLVRA